MQEEGVVGPCVGDEPLHGADDVALGWLHDGVLLVVGQDDHILALIAVILYQEGRDVLGVVDAPAQLSLLAKVIDANKKRASLARAVGVLEGIALGRAVTELL